MTKAYNMKVRPIMLKRKGLVLKKSSLASGKDKSK